MKNKNRIIYANEFLNRLENTVYDTPTDFGYTPGLVKTVLAQTKSVDAVEVVRCKECKQWSRNSGIAESPNGHCFYHDIDTNGYDFCSYGERN